jgi:hypothetical protein
VIPAQTAIPQPKQSSLDSLSWLGARLTRALHHQAAASQPGRQ